ncbi:MAG TPA: Lrp/AsnC family transcriptional regulator [Phycisphaerae bacterium]|nr:Lrp/AsnC family transcriptional regulator [Phycisphaerae bacterium]
MTTTPIPSAPLPIHTADPTNAAILAIAEDKIQGFVPDPLAQISQKSAIPIPIVAARIAAMLKAGTIRRVRQTLMSINLAKGALVAWKVPPDLLNAAFEFMWEKDPFSGHIVIRSTDRDTPGGGGQYRLWTTLKIPDGYSMEKHCQLLCRLTGAETFKIMPAARIFALGVGHVRRRGMEPGAKSDSLAEPKDTRYVQLSPIQWQTLIALKREFTPDEIEAAAARDPHLFWQSRAADAQLSLPEFLATARGLHELGVIGRFSTFLEHVKPNAAGERVTTYNALFHWAVPRGREIETGQQVARFHIITHAYWREGGPEFNGVNIMAVAHGTDKERVLAHKAAIDAHLADIGIPVAYTNVFWGGRSEIKPSEISPLAYADWCRAQNVDPESMRA